MDEKKSETEQAEETSPASRRGFLKIMGATAAAVSGSQLVPDSAVAAAASGEPQIALDVVDYIDGHYVLAARSAHLVAGMPTSGSPLRLRDGLKIELTSGRAEIREDRYTGAILLKPGAGEVVRARATAPARSAAAALVGSNTDRTVGGPEAAVGYDAKGLPPGQLLTDAAGGGACKASGSPTELRALMAPMTEHLSAERRAVVESLAGDGYRTSLRVRAAIMGNVIPLAPDQRAIHWRHARYYGYEAMLGLLRFTYNTGSRSTLSMQGRGRDFYPPPDSTRSTAGWRCSTSDSPG
ncbi:hypothetical protein [Kitasatospora sp. NPDC002040]|uniref:hypothetical protein n=1 Tax=Kitasatospora sp. NPDC002040 TaxID=3154661 RepID=UPI00331DC5B5